MRRTEHEIVVAAPADTVYQLIADVQRWPQLFPPTIHVEHVDRGEREERIRIWATANGEPKSWVSRRMLEPDHRRINFQQEVSTPPVASMGGAWVIEPRSDSESRVRLLHEYRSVGDDPDGLAWIDRAVDGNSRAELAALKESIELAHGPDELAFSFEDTVRVNGSVKDVYDFVNEADRWPERLPHVARVVLTEDAPGLQCLEMDTRAVDGSTHTTKSYRVTLPHRVIAYKQVTLPALMKLHAGWWTFREEDGAVLATSAHTVVLNAGNVPRILGEQATVGAARAYVHNALSTNSRTTLEHAKAYAEER